VLRIKEEKIRSIRKERQREEKGDTEKKREK
jgi:hypothetical protein